MQISIRAPAWGATSPVTTTVNAKQLTQRIHRVALLKSTNYRELSNESDIKSAAAFFSISFFGWMGTNQGSELGSALVGELVENKNKGYKEKLIIDHKPLREWFI